MSWFSFSGKKQPKAVTAPTSSVTVKSQKTKGMIWLETSSEEVYVQTLSNMYKEIEELSGYPKKADAHNAAVFAHVILRKIKKIDRTRLNADQKRDLAAVVFTSIPRAVSKMETQLADIDDRDWAVEEFGDTLRSLMTKYIDSMPRKIPIPNQLTTVTHETTKRAVETVGSEVSDKKLAEITELAAEAYKLATSVEDRFFAEQAANSYIPDSVRMLAGLIHAPEDMKAEANELFLKQLEIIEVQLRGVIRRSASNSLSAMKAHTEFLESKNNPTNNILDLH